MACFGLVLTCFGLDDPVKDPVIRASLSSFLSELYSLPVKTRNDMLP